MRSPALRIADLTVRFDGRAVLQNFSLRLAAGEKVLVTGRSGSGKSTLLRCILGFTIPERGTIDIAGQRVTGVSIWRLRTQMAYVAQEPELGPGKVREVLALPFAYRANAPLKETHAGVENLFRRFLLPVELLDKDAATLSGGEKQRVAIIAAVLLSRPIVLLDEATSALDHKARQAVAEFFAAKPDVTVLAVAHDRQDPLFPGEVVELSARGHGGGP